jgi:peptide/nickel transport system permease protein
MLQTELQSKSVMRQSRARLDAFLRSGASAWMVLIGTVIISAVVLITIVGPYISPYNPSAINVGPILQPPDKQFPLGTNHLGQDMLSRVLSGGMIMLQVAFLSVVICSTVGVAVGLVASYAGGLSDKISSLVMDSIYAFPGLVLAIAITAMLGPGVVNMALAIAVVYIPSYFRVVRSQVMTIKSLTYIEAARALGARTRKILGRYILPNTIPSIVVVVTLNFSDAILTAAGLTFLGLGVPVSTPDWGWDITYGRGLLFSGAWWVIGFPGLMIVLAAFGFTILGEGLSEFMNPRLRERA